MTVMAALPNFYSQGFHKQDKQCHIKVTKSTCKSYVLLCNWEAWWCNYKHACIKGSNTNTIKLLLAASLSI